MNSNRSDPPDSKKQKKKKKKKRNPDNKRPPKHSTLNERIRYVEKRKKGEICQRCDSLGVEYGHKHETKQIFNFDFLLYLSFHTKQF